MFPVSQFVLPRQVFGSLLRLPELAKLLFTDTLNLSDSPAFPPGAVPFSKELPLYV